MMHVTRILNIETIENKVRELRCPFCEYTASTVSSYIVHVTKTHPLIECPVCGYRGKDILGHMAKHNDKLHMLFYAIYGSYGKGTHQRAKKLKKLRIELWK